MGVAIISSRWKNWGPGQKVGAEAPGPGLEPPLSESGNRSSGANFYILF